MFSKLYRQLLTLLLTCALFGVATVILGNARPVAGQDDEPPAAPQSPRLIVELESPPLAAIYREQVGAAAINGKLDLTAAAAQAYIAQLRSEQAAFVAAMQATAAGTTVAAFINERGSKETATYQVVFNGLAIDVGPNDRAALLPKLAKLPGVKQVYLDQPYYTQLYTSTALINTPVLWAQLGGQAAAGAGIKVASIDGGVHHAAPMMAGTGYSYPPGYGPNGLGLTANNNGKIIVSRAYFRPWDPPAVGDENPWPGKAGTSHGMHTASTAAGDRVEATYLGLNLGQMSGVAPKAYVMSYRVFYASVNGIESFYTTEGLAALEDLVLDGADVVNNSWGDGPSSSGGRYDPLDQALINAANAGIFVSVSAGNSGPGLGTSDHPSADYITVAASTSGGTLAAGRVGVPNVPTLQNIAFSPASFGAQIPVAQRQTFTYLPGSAVDEQNSEGCKAFPANAFADKAALLIRGGCEFGRKVLNAEQAGATFVVVYNHADGGDALSNMGPGVVGNQVTIASIFIGHTAGSGLLDLYTNQGAAAAKLELDTVAFQAGNHPDRIIDFSSRGPGVGGTLKPDIAAPGVNIVAQGYTYGVTGEARHLGYGQVSGTSMASPHVAGAAALVKQAHPTWSPAWIKSALMSTAKYTDIYLADDKTPAQPLDMGAGRLDLSRVTNPGVILDPPSLSFGYLISGTQQTITVSVTSVATGTESYTLRTLYTGDGFTQTTTLPGFQVTPTVLTLAAGETKQVQVTFNTVTGQGLGDNQGYLILDGTNHDAHLAAWARVTPAMPRADVLLVDGDFSTIGPFYGFALDDYRWYYTSALQALGYSYNVLDYDLYRLPDAASLLGYRAVIYFTGDNYVNGAGLGDLDMDRLVEYLNAGGTVIVMGQDMAATIDHDVTDPGNPHFFYGSRLAANWIQDSVSDDTTPQAYIVESTGAPAMFADLLVDLTAPRRFIAAGELTGAAAVPAVSPPISGTFAFYHDLDSNYSDFSVTVALSSTQGVTVTGLQLQSGAVGATGPVIVDLAATAGLTLPVYVTDSLTIAGTISPTLTAGQVDQMLNNRTYLNVRTSDFVEGAIRGQLLPDYLENQAYVDELDNHYHDGTQDPTGMDNLQSIPLLKYQGPYNLYDGTVAMGHRQQPSLENPGTTYAGRSIYATFGLEGVSNDFNPALASLPTSRSEVLGTFLDWAWSQPPTTVQISNTVAVSSTLYLFEAAAAYGVQASSSTAVPPTPVQYRWDFGDRSAYSVSSTPEASHIYRCSVTPNPTVRVEITDNYGNVIIGSTTLDVSRNCSTANGPAKVLFLPMIAR